MVVSKLCLGRALFRSFCQMPPILLVEGCHLSSCVTPLPDGKTEISVVSKPKIQRKLDDEHVPFHGPYSGYCPQRVKMRTPELPDAVKSSLDSVDIGVKRINKKLLVELCFGLCVGGQRWKLRPDAMSSYLSGAHSHCSAPAL